MGMGVRTCCGRLRGQSCGLLSLLLLPPPLSPPSPPSLPLQVRSSLGTNILSAMAAFAGTAILLMDFGVTNWVCCPTSPGVGKLEEEQQPHPGGGTGGGKGCCRALGISRACQSQETPRCIWTPGPYVKGGRSWGEGAGRGEAILSSRESTCVQGRVRVTQQGDPLQLCMIWGTLYSLLWAPFPPLF